jgi:hypothetical protein
MIANELGRTSGTVRVQIHRGLEMLRKALPAGFAAAEPWRWSRRARWRTCARACSVQCPAAAGPRSRSEPGPRSGGLVLKKLGLAAAVLVVAGGALWLAHDRLVRA